MDYDDKGQPIESADFISNPLSDPLAHLQAHVDKRLSAYAKCSKCGSIMPGGYCLRCWQERPNIYQHKQADSNADSGHGMHEKAEDFIGGHVFFSDRGVLKESNQPPTESSDFMGRVPRGSSPQTGPFSDGTAGEGDPPKESLSDGTGDMARWADLSDEQHAQLGPARQGSAPEEPPNYRPKESKQRCGTCKMNFEGKCWGYGNKAIKPDMVCDSFYPESKKAKGIPGLLPGNCPQCHLPLYGSYECPKCGYRFPHDGFETPDNHEEFSEFLYDPGEQGLDIGPPHFGSTALAGINHDRGSWGRGVVGPDQQVHTWPEDWGTHNEFVHQVLNAYPMDYSKFSISPGGDIHQLDPALLPLVQNALASDSMEKWTNFADYPLDPGHTLPGEIPGQGLCPECQTPLKDNFCPNCKAYHKEAASVDGIDLGSPRCVNCGSTDLSATDYPQPIYQCRDCASYTKIPNEGFQVERHVKMPVYSLPELGPVRQGHRPPKISAQTRNQKLRQAEELEALHGQPDMSQIVHEFPDGHSIRKLTNVGDLNREGGLMRHCWGRQFWTDQHNYDEWRHAYPEADALRNQEWTSPIGRELSYSGHPGYYSLRDPDNLPRLSFNGSPDYNGTINPYGVYGSHNSEPKPELLDYLSQWQDAQRQQSVVASGLSRSGSAKPPVYFRDKNYHPFHCHPWTGKRCYCGWGWNSLLKWRKEHAKNTREAQNAREASQNVRMLRNQNRKVFRSDEGKAFLDHLEGLVNGLTYHRRTPHDFGAMQEHTLHHPEIEPLVPWLAHRYAKGDIRFKPGIEPEGEDKDQPPVFNYEIGQHTRNPEYTRWTGQTPQLKWFSHPNLDRANYPFETHEEFWNRLPLGALGEWFNARQAPARQGVNIMDLDPVGVQHKLNEHEEWFAEKQRREEYAEEVAGAGEPIHNFGNDYHVRELKSPDDLEAESHAMEHCIGDEGQDYIKGLEGGHLRAFSLRDKTGWPHATWHINTRDNSLAHVQGASGEPREDYRKMISDFNQHMNFGDREVGDYDYDEPEYDESYEFAPADTVEKWLALHGPDASPYEMAENHYGANVGPDTEFEFNTPDWNEIVSDARDYGPHSEWAASGAGKPRWWRQTHDEADREQFFNALHQQGQAPEFENALHEEEDPEDPDYTELRRLWEENSAPHRTPDGQLHVPAFVPSGYVPVSDPRHPDYEEPPAEQLPGVDWQEGEPQ